MLTKSLAALFFTSAALTAQSPRQINGRGNPILADGSFYSADPAPVVTGDVLYILAGRDEAPEGVNDFVMKEWQLFATRDVASHQWQQYPALLKPAEVFAWASPDHAYAGQIVEGRDKRFYLYAPVQQADSPNKDPFAIGVAVSNSPLGPWKDAHPAGPIISQSIPEPNDIQNIDPTAMVDDDGRVYLYWGTFGQLRGIELQPDMVTPMSHSIAVKTLDGFFEAPWLMKRNGTYYMIYAYNKAGPNSPCTPAVYHACIAYGTSRSPLGPWTYRGVILAPVSSTTSHPGAVEFKGKWYLIYHTADAVNGGHFRRSVAIDEMKWDDSVSPARILEVKQTHAPKPPAPRTRNIAPAARASASNEPIPVQYWINALNDGIVRANPLPPDMWASWTPHNPASQWIRYTWSHAVTLNASRILFWSDHPAGASEGIAPPAGWHLEYLAGNQWYRIKPAGGYPVSQSWITIAFSPIRTTSLRAVFEASGSTQGHAAVAVQEWEALAPK
jgi:beta-xylosidase